MFPAIFSVLLFGMLPTSAMQTQDQSVLSRLTIAPPSTLTAHPEDFAGLSTVTASGVLIIDAQSGQTVFAREADSRRPIASLTKLMTALVITERHDLTELVTVPADVTHEGHVVHLPPGEHLTVGDLLTAMLVDSANDAADTLARFDAGSTAIFAERMNARAAELGLKDSSFRNPAGFDDPEHWSTARDIGWLTSYVLRRPELRRRLSLRSASIATSEGTEIALIQTHQLLHESSPVIAGKTGTTDDAHECLDSVVKLGNREYIVVLLGSRERYADMRIVLALLASLVA